MKLSFSKTIAVTISVCIVILLFIQTYFINEVNRISKAQAISYGDSIAGQTEESMNAMLKNTTYSALYLSEHSVTRSYLQSKEPLDQYNFDKYVSDTIRTVLALDSYTMNIILLDAGHNITYSYSSIGYTANNHVIETIKQTPSTTGRLFFLSKTKMRDYLICYVPIYANNEQLGSLVFVLNINEIKKVFEQVNDNGQVELYLLDSENNIIAANSEAPIYDTDNGELAEFTYLERNLREPGFRIICKINGSAVSDQYSFFRKSTILIAAVMVILLAVIGLIFNKSIASPIQQLISEVNEIGISNKTRVLGEYGYQLDPLAGNINDMLEKTANLNLQLLSDQRKIYTQELLRRESDLYALRNQINPHFLFNTLQSIGGVALMHNEREIADITTGMAEMFYYSLKGSDTVLAKDELSMLTKYLKIMSFRFPEKFSWQIDVPIKIQNYLVPKMLIQPLVENAITHGIEKREDDHNGIVRLSASEDGEFILFMVTDNGSMTIKKADELNSMLSNETHLGEEVRAKNGIGLANIQYRVKLIYGSDCGLDVLREEEKTVITLKIRKEIPSPIQGLNDEQNNNFS